MEFFKILKQEEYITNDSELLDISSLQLQKYISLSYVTSA